MHRAIAFALSIFAIGSLATAQERPSGSVDARWSYERDADDHTRVTVTADGHSFHAEVDRHALVRLGPGQSPDLLRALGAVPIREVSTSLHIWRVVDTGDRDGLDLALRLAPRLEAIPDLILVHTTRDISVPPDDPRYGGQWFFDRLDMEEAWSIEDGDEATTIVIVDSGCELDHPDLVAHMDQGRDVIDGDDDPTPSTDDGSEHGTACAGLAAAATDNATGIAGACPECRLRCVRMLDGISTPIPLSADIEAFQFALDVDAAVVSNSWGFIEATPIPMMLRDMIELVIDTGRGGRGALVLFASGNDNRELFDYEIEAVRGVITVGATNNFDEATAFSNRGESVDLVAPTGTVTTDISGAGGADPTDYTASFGGTSSACPIAAGIAGLLASASPDSTGAEISDALISSARQSPFASPDADGHDLLYGYGLIAPAPALRELLDLPEPMPDAGMPDAGMTDDAGMTETPGGCGCSSARPSRAPLAILFVMIALALTGRSGPSSRASGGPARSPGGRA